jgi:ferritin-like metal-binding protein YciE
MQTAGQDIHQKECWKVTKMNRWMKRRIERSRARCATEKHGLTPTEGQQVRVEQLSSELSRVIEKQSLKLGLQAKVE